MSGVRVSRRVGFITQEQEQQHSWNIVHLVVAVAVAVVAHTHKE